MVPEENRDYNAVLPFSTILYYSRQLQFSVADNCPFILDNDEDWIIHSIKGVGKVIPKDVFNDICKLRSLVVIRHQRKKKDVDKEIQILPTSVPILILEVSGTGTILKFQLTGHVRPITQKLQLPG